MKTIKIIDLLNMISKGEEVPKKIKYKDEIRDYVDDDKDYCCSGSKNYYLFFDVLHRGTGAEFKKALNDEVEIIEEKKLPEKLIPTSLKGIDNLDEKIEIAHIDTISVIDTVNKILDYLESKEKGE